MVQDLQVETEPIKQIQTEGKLEKKKLGNSNRKPRGKPHQHNIGDRRKNLRH